MSWPASCAVLCKCLLLLCFMWFYIPLVSYHLHLQPQVDTWLLKHAQQSRWQTFGAVVPPAVDTPVLCAVEGLTFGVA